MKRIIYIAISIVLLINACKEADFQQYVDKDRLQFGPNQPDLIYRSDYETNWKFQDTTKSYSFYFEEEDVTVDTLYFDLYTLGRVTDYDRPYRLIQVQEPGIDNAVAGTHYQAFDDAKSQDLYVVKAGQSHIRVPLVFLRDPSLKEKPYLLSIRLQPNEHFDLGPTTNIWRKATVVDRLLRPTAWTNSYWGVYSLTKHQFMIDATGQKWDQEMMENLAYDETTYYRAVLKQALAEYNNEHNTPLTDEDGNEVIFP